MCYCGADSNPTAYWESMPVARKEHICCECGSIIDIGEKYYRISGVWDKKFHTFKQCQTCVNVWKEATIKKFRYICFGDLWKTVGNEYEYAGLL